MDAAKSRAYEIIDSLSEQKVAEAINFLAYLRIKEELEATSEVMSDATLMRAIKQGMLQYDQSEIVDEADVIKNV